MLIRYKLICVALFTPAWLSASDLADGDVALRQLNSESWQALRLMDQSTKTRRQPLDSHDLYTQQAIRHQQAFNLRRLQAKQQHELSAQKRRHQAPAAGLSPGLRSKLQQQRFRLQQNQLLRRFKTQRQYRATVPRR